MPPPGYELERGQAGASLEREYEKRRRNRESRVREAHPHIAGLLLALGDAPQSETAFRSGSEGEQMVAASLEERTAQNGTIRLDNRRMPRGRGDIDHIAVAPSGVYVIDAKSWKGKVEIASPWFGPQKLLINGRDCSKLIDGLERQLAVVRGVLDTAGYEGTSIYGALCFTKADLPWLRTQKLRGHLLIYPRALAKRLNAAGPLSREEIRRIADRIGADLPPA